MPYGARSLIEIPQSIYAPKKYDILPTIDIENRPLKKPATGWCSWYTYGWDITEKRILKNAKWISENKKLPLEYILVDAGWANAGDWFHEWKFKFPDGLKGMVSKIKSMGLKAGIWVAPFMVDPWSKTARQHPEWLIRNGGKLVDGFRLTPWDDILPFRKWIMDLKNPDVQKYLLDSISRLVEDVGVDMLKLDFLYSIYFDPSLTMIDADKLLKDFLMKIRNKYPNLYTIGCGCPLIPAINSFDSMRLGPDSVVSPFVKFLPLSGVFDRLYMHKRVTKTLHNRMWMRDLWNIDPDALVCRSDIGLSEDQISFSLETIKIAKGNIFLGDDLSKLPEERIEKYIYPLFE